eukprot:CAMPEP_0181480438 /NCGR_PEP_ID=MMETSP1110-20121109/43800_1 /TAXON_ID=174948 /ORGANISM="Symbiodinium sp., Strain CCMP421" /LENGTH=964 /DNA_ID=CAMNT_0023605907 /DNA_START=49 /DNA_END=2941 /DNA_ORIENTATION=+
MCDSPTVWQDRLDPSAAKEVTTKELGISGAKSDGAVAKQGFLHELSDQIAAALRNHAASLHRQLETLLVEQELLARKAEEKIEFMVRAAMDAPGPSNAMDFGGLPGEVWHEPTVEPAIEPVTPPAAIEPIAPPRDEFVSLTTGKDVLGTCDGGLSLNDSASAILAAIPSMLQSSLHEQEQWHSSCLQNWTSRQDARREQACDLLGSLLRKEVPLRRSASSEKGLSRFGSGDTLPSADITEVPMSPSPQAKCPNPLSTLESTTFEVATTLQLHTPTSPAPPKRSWFPVLDPPNCRRSGFLLLEDSSHYLLGRIISGFMFTVIMVSTVSFVVETLPSMQERPGECAELLAAGEALTVEACEPVPWAIFSTLEAICIVIFTLEYVLRLSLCHTDARYGSSYLSRTFHYAIQPLNVIDVVAVLPFYLKLSLEWSNIGVLSMLRLMRVCRLLKLAKHHKGIMICWEALVHSGLPLALLFFYDVLFGIIFATIMHTLEGSTYSVAPEFTDPYLHARTGKEMPPKYPTGVFVRPDIRNAGVEPSPFFSIPAALWWVFTTTTTVGYGDFAPTTTFGQCLGVVVFYFGIILLALPIGVVSSNFEHAYEKHQGTRRRRQSFLTGTLSTSDQRRVSMRASGDMAWLPPSKSSCRRGCFIVMNDPNSSVLATGLSYISFALITVTTVSSILESMPVFSYTPEGCLTVELSVEMCQPQPDPIFEQIEVIGTIFFTVEYAIRISLAHAATEQELGLKEDANQKPSHCRKTFRYALQPLNVIDVVAVVPFYLERIGLGGSSTAVLRVLRLVRIFRVLKSPKMRACVDMILCIVIDALPGIASVFSLTCLVCIMFASCMFYAEGTLYSVDYDPEEFPMGVYIRPSKDGSEMEPTPFRSISHTFWWFFATATTVGYGDYVPTTTMGKIIAIFVFYIGIVLVAIKLTKFKAPSEDITRCSSNLTSSNLVPLRGVSEPPVIRI